jgi:MurNAc alpha-1-phosphate uridylyltransferase
VINAAHLAEQLIAHLDDGPRWVWTLRWSLEPEPLEVAGGIATALPLLPSGPVLIVSGDVWSAFDYASLAARGAAMKDRNDTRVHLVMVPNPAHHPGGDFVLAGGRITEARARG